MTDFRHLPIEPRLKQLAMPLSIIFQVWPDGEEQFEGYLLARQRELRRARSTSWEGTLFNLVYSIAVGDIDLKDSFPEYYSQDGNIEAIIPTMIAKQMSSKPKSITQGLTSIGFEVQSRRLPSGDKKPRLYCVPDARKWREVVSRYYYSELDDPPTEAPEVLRGSKYIMFPEPSQVSQVSPPLTKPAAPKETGTDGTDGTLTSTRNNVDDDTPASDNGRFETALGMSVNEALELWRSEGAPDIEFGPGENCKDLEKLLANKDIKPEHLKAVADWLRQRKGR